MIKKNVFVVGSGAQVNRVDVKDNIIYFISLLPTSATVWVKKIKFDVIS